MSTSPVIERMAVTLADQRAAFGRHPFPGLAERKSKLKALRDAIKRHQDAMVAAVDADFGGRAAAETKLIDVLGPVLGINHALAGLRGWMQPRRRRTELLFLGNRARVEYQPKGVVGIIVPWNFPGYLALGPLVAAIAAGNRAMVKMSELTPRTTELLARLLAEVFPESEVAVFGGDVEEARAFARLAFDHLVFTGSPAIGREVMRAAAENLVPVTLELGGKSPAVIAPGANLEDAAARIAHGKALNAGQVCLAPDYALVPRASVAAFAGELLRAFRRMYPRIEDNADYTCMVSDRHAERMRALVADARARGAEALVAGLGSGRRVPLTILTGVDDGMRVMREEIFGPILPIVAYDSIEQATAHVATRARPLALYAFGFDRAGLERLKKATHSGGVSVNDWGWHAFQHDLPFGGIGNSGMGSYHGEEGFRELSHAKAVFERHRFFPVGLFYPPYGNFVQRLAMHFYLGRQR